MDKCLLWQHKFKYDLNEMTFFLHDLLVNIIHKFLFSGTSIMVSTDAITAMKTMAADPKKRQMLVKVLLSPFKLFIPQIS